MAAYDLDGLDRHVSDLSDLSRRAERSTPGNSYHALCLHPLWHLVLYDMCQVSLTIFADLNQIFRTRFELRRIDSYQTPIIPF